MKDCIQIIALFLFMVVMFFFAIKNEETQNETLRTELAMTKDSLNMVRHDFKEHLSKCAFISVKSIQKVSTDGRFITLFSPINTNRP